MMRKREVRKVGRKTGSRAGWPLGVAALAAFVWVGIAAAPAQADSNFERGFEDQMGRILAYEAVNLGKTILFQGVVHGAGHGHGPSHGGHAYGAQHGPVYTANPQVVYQYAPARHKSYRPAPKYTHQWGKRPVHWKRHDRHPGKHFGHHKGKHARRYGDRHGYGHHGYGHRHDRHCRH